MEAACAQVEQLLTSADDATKIPSARKIRRCVFKDIPTQVEGPELDYSSWVPQVTDPIYGH